MNQEAEEALLQILEANMRPLAQEPGEVSAEEDALTEVAAGWLWVREATRDLDGAVDRARAAGLSWADIGRAAGGITRQSARERWGKLQETFPSVQHVDDLGPGAQAALTVLRTALGKKLCPACGHRRFEHRMSPDLDRTWIGCRGCDEECSGSRTAQILT